MQSLAGGSALGYQRDKSIQCPHANQLRRRIVALPIPGLLSIADALF